jgi:hypothetical protein
VIVRHLYGFSLNDKNMPGKHPQVVDMFFTTEFLFRTDLLLCFDHRGRGED